MKALILLPLFALLPFLAFPNGVPEITQKEKENTIEIIENIVTEFEISNSCTAIAYGTISTPTVDIDFKCTKKSSTCKEAIREAKECIEQTMECFAENCM